MKFCTLRAAQHYAPTVERLKNVLGQEGLPAQVQEIKIRDELTAKAWNFFGSPTIRANGLDIEVDARDTAQTGVACRRYSGGIPSEEMIRSALREARTLGDGVITCQG